MRFLFFLFCFSFCFCTYAADTYPPSPAGGGYFQIYAESDYVFAPGHDDFDVNLQKKGFTIEMWIYLTRPLKELDKPAAQGFEEWNLIEKKDSYRLYIKNGKPLFTFTHPKVGLIWRVPEGHIPENQWIYTAVTLSNLYVQQIVDTRLWGRKVRDLGDRDIKDLLAFRTSDSPLQIGGGGPSLIGILEGPLKGKPLLSNFTGGLIDEVRISNIVRYPWAQLNKEFWKDTIQVPTGPFEPDRHTIALWHFNFDGSGGSRWHDASGNGHHLTYHGDYLGIESTQKLAVTWAELKGR